jgi:choice-of-anchor A domain-containing protein
MQRANVRIAAFLVTVVAMSATATAANLGVANTFNAFIFGNAATQGGHADGAVAVGGDWSGTNYELKQSGGAPFGEVPEGNKAGLYLKGQNNVSNFLRLNGGNAYYGQNLGTIQINGGGSAFNTVTNSVFSTQQTYSQNQSTAIANLGGTAINTSDPNNVFVNLATIAGSVKVLTLDVTQVTGNRTLNFQNGNASDTVLVNLIGGDTLTWGWQLNYAHKNRVLFNFGGKTVTVKDRDFDGSLLAPYATINQYRNIQGNLIAKDWNVYNSVELHFGNQFTFTGDAPPPVPEPASMAVLGIGAMSLLRRRARR